MKKTYLFALGDVLFLTVPVAAWILIHERDWRQSNEMALAMVAPVALVVSVGEVMRYPYLLWLVTAMYPLMCIGMIADMIYRRDWVTAHDVHRQGLGSRVISPGSKRGLQHN